MREKGSPYASIPQNNLYSFLSVINVWQGVIKGSVYMVRSWMKVASFSGHSLDFILQPWIRDMETAVRKIWEWPGNEARMKHIKHIKSISHVLGLTLTCRN